MRITHTSVKNALTRATGYLKTVCSHSLQPYRGCAFGQALCGVGCYVRHNQWILRGEEWGTFLEVRANAAESYARHFDRERTWARNARGSFSVFLSSSTDPFVPQEERFGVTASILDAMLMRPPDELIVQTHTHRVVTELARLEALAAHCKLRVHLSIESDRDRLPGLPSPASSVQSRLAAARTIKGAGIRVVITVSPLLPIADPDGFFRRIAQDADAVVLDHFIGGDGSHDGARTLRTRLPAAMASVDPSSVSLEYRERMLMVARRHLGVRVGVGIDGFAGRFSDAMT